MSKPKTAGLRTWTLIDRSAIAHNFKIFRKLIPKETKLLAVVKSNAYGHNLTEFAVEMERLGADMLGVDSAVEGFSLRKTGVKVPILVLGHTLPEMYARAARERIIITISSMEGLQALVRANTKSTAPHIHLKIDTGMHRQGFLREEIPQVIRFLKKNKEKIHLDGTYTHFAAAKSLHAKEHAAYTQKQIAEFEEWVHALRVEGLEPTIHAGATSGLLLFPSAHFDMVRAGIGLYGVWPSEDARRALGGKVTLKPVLTWKSIVAEIKTIPKGSMIGYDLTEKVTRDTRIGIVPVGYWHGYPRSLSGKGEVLVRGKRARVLGRVCMDMIIIDLTDIPQAKVGDEVVLIGRSGKEEVTADEIARRSGTSAYEILTRLNPLMKRIYK